MTRPYDYIAYIDESGDTGLANVRPFKPDGSSEWFVIAAAVIAADREGEFGELQKKILKDINSRQRQHLHFRDIKDDNKRLRVCEMMAGFPARYFVVASNKKNMQNHRNPFVKSRAESLVGMPTGWNYNWYYYWMSRILLEKVTKFTLARSLLDHGQPRQLRAEFSENKGLRYDELGFYYDLLKMHDKQNTQTANYDHITWSVLDRRENVRAYPHDSRPGLQFADAVATSFFFACDNQQTGPCEPKFAWALRDRMPKKDNGNRAGFSVKLMPSVREARLTSDQFEIFRRYGYF